MSDLERQVGRDHSNLPPPQHAESRIGLSGEVESAQVLDFLCPGCGAAVAISYEVGLGMKSGGYRLLKVWEEHLGDSAAP